MGRCFNEDGEPQEDKKFGLVEGLKTVYALEMMFSFRSVSFGTKKDLNEWSWNNEAQFFDSGLQA